jgi:hypothetical protein
MFCAIADGMLPFTQQKVQYSCTLQTRIHMLSNHPKIPPKSVDRTAKIMLILNGCHFAGFFKYGIVQIERQLIMTILPYGL